MDLTIWTKQYFDINSKLEWSCPSCEKNSLEIKKENFFSGETAESKKMRSEDQDWEVEWITLNFSGVLECKDCGEIVTFTGKGNVEHSGYYNYEMDDYVEEYNNVFSPTFFQPALHIFKIPKKCPTNVREEIIASFKLYWSDLSASANKIRSALEILLTEEKVKRFQNKNGKRIPIFLHHRIESYKNKEVIEFLLAIKWIGNTGSHIGGLEKIDILEAYKMLEFSLNKIYDNKEKEVKKIAKEINKRKGTRKR